MRRSATTRVWLGHMPARRTPKMARPVSPPGLRLGVIFRRFGAAVYAFGPPWA